MEEKLNAREKAVAILLVLIAVLFLILQVISYISSRSPAYVAEGEQIRISRAELLNDIRVWTTILCGFLAGILLFRKKRTGWILSIAYLLFFLFLTGWGMYQAVRYLGNGISWLSGAGTLFLLVALIVLLMPATRKKFRVGRSVLIPTLIVLAILTVLYFFLQ